MELKAQRAAALEAAQKIVEQAKAAGRDLTAEESSTIEAKFAEVDNIDAKIAEHEKSRETMRRLAGVVGSDSGEKDGDKPSARSLGEHFVKSVGQDGFSRLKSISGTSVQAPEFKANTDAHTVPESFGPLLTQVDRTVVQAYRRPTVADVFGQGTLGRGTNAVTYFVEGAFEGNFATVAEGAQKPQFHDADPTAVTDAAKKIAGWFDTSDEMIEDLDFWVSEVNNRGLYQLSLVEESQLVNGDGQGTNILGLLNRSGIQTEEQGAEGDNAADALFRAATKVQTATGLTADAILINPADYQPLRLNKDGNGQYYGGGYFYGGDFGPETPAMTPNLWGMRTIVTPAVPAKTAVVGALRTAATVYRKGGVRVESTNSDGTKFTQNKVTTRIEERIALALRMPAAVVKVTLL